jgi:hypothetical protein
MTKKNYVQAPLPFQGQKRRFCNEFKAALNSFEKVDIIVDLFGGSGLLSHWAKKIKPNARVIYNDFDDYSLRLNNIEKTNILLTDIREIVGKLERDKKLPDEIKSKILQRISREKSYVDYATLSTWLIFSAKYVRSFQELTAQSFYNNVKFVNYELPAGYLDGVEVVKCDYRVLFDKYRHFPNVLFICDPPYLSTDCSTYNSKMWRLGDFLDVINVLWNNSFFYFTSNKSGIIELFEWLGKNFAIAHPFQGAKMKTVQTSLNKSASYIDIMLYKEIKK